MTDDRSRITEYPGRVPASNLALNITSSPQNDVCKSLLTPPCRQILNCPSVPSSHIVVFLPPDCQPINQNIFHISRFFLRRSTLKHFEWSFQGAICFSALKKQNRAVDYRPPGLNWLDDGKFAANRGKSRRFAACDSLFRTKPGIFHFEKMLGIRTSLLSLATVTNTARWQWCRPHANRAA